MGGSAIVVRLDAGFAPVVWPLVVVAGVVAVVAVAAVGAVAGVVVGFVVAGTSQFLANLARPGHRRWQYI